MYWLILLFMYMSAAIFFHGLLCQLCIKFTTFAKFIIVGIIIGCVLLFHFYIIYGWSVEFISAALLYAFLCELYIFIFTFISSSISVSILLRIAKNDINRNDLSNEYCGEMMVNNRLRRMLEIGLLNENDKVLNLTKTGEVLTKRFNKLQSFFRLNSYQ